MISLASRASQFASVSIVWPRDSLILRSDWSDPDKSRLLVGQPHFAFWLCQRWLYIFYIPVSIVCHRFFDPVIPDLAYQHHLYFWHQLRLSYPNMTLSFLLTALLNHQNPLLPLYWFWSAPVSKVYNTAAKSLIKCNPPLQKLFPSNNNRPKTWKRIKYKWGN